MQTCYLSKIHIFFDRKIKNIFFWFLYYNTIRFMNMLYNRPLSTVKHKADLSEIP